MLKFKKHKKSLSDHDLVSLETCPNNTNKKEYDMFSFKQDFFKNFLVKEQSKSNQSEGISLSPRSATGGEIISHGNLQTPNEKNKETPEI